MPALVTSGLVWKEIEKRSFAVLSYVNPKGQARSSGIVYVPIDRVLYVRVAKTSWKAKHIRLNPHVAINVTISKRVPFMPWIKVPDATIAFSGTARVVAMSDVEPKLLETIQGRMIEQHGTVDGNCIIEIRPTVTSRPTASVCLSWICATRKRRGAARRLAERSVFPRIAA
jgi:hypothetical protein